MRESTAARPRSGASAAASPGAGSGAAWLPACKVSVRCGLPRAAPSPPSVNLNWPPAVPADAAWAENCPASTPAPACTRPPARVSVLRLMSSVPALPATVCRPVEKSLVGLPSRAALAASAVIRAPGAHSSIGLRRVTLPASSSRPRSSLSVLGASTGRPDTSMWLASPRRSTP